MSDPRETPRDGGDPQVPPALPPGSGDEVRPAPGSAPDGPPGDAPEAPAFETPPPPRAGPMLRAMIGIGLGCGLLIVSVFQLTAPVIAANRAALLQRAIFDVLPAATQSRSFALVDDARFEPLGDGERDPAARVVHAGFADDGRLVGLAIEAAGMGYADTITVLYGYDHAAEQVVGLAVLASKETPGLGDRIETDAAFVANFAALDVALDDAGAAKRNAVVAVKQGAKQQPWEVDGITGATISSVAIADILEQSTEFWAPRIQARLDDLVAEGAP